MGRPSTHTDQRLIQTAREMLPRTGCSGLSLREVANRAGVNLGMFHYHFKTKEEFLRRVLGEIYQDFFKDFSLQCSAHQSPFENLRVALITLGKFSRDNREFIYSMIYDLMSSEDVALQFASESLGKHGRVIRDLISLCRKERLLVEAPLSQTLLYLMTSINFPNLIAGQLGWIQGFPKEDVGREVLSDEAIVQRVDFALRGLKA